MGRGEDPLTLLVLAFVLLDGCKELLVEVSVVEETAFTSSWCIELKGSRSVCYDPRSLVLVLVDLVEGYSSYVVALLFRVSVLDGTDAPIELVRVGV